MLLATMLLQEFLNMQTGNTVLLSIYPRYANKILSGEKRVEFRKAWPSSGVSTIVIYATVPVQKIVGVARVKRVHQGSPTALWSLAQALGGGVSRRDLYSYFRGKEAGFGIEIDSIQPCSIPLDPQACLVDFNPPQSFMYLDHASLVRIEGMLKKQPPKGRVLFVAGVHGVGKTTLCTEYANNHGLLHKSASELIREEKEVAISRTNKLVKDVSGNQQLLINAVERIRATGKTLLLDGHFALMNKARKIEALPAKVFADLRIDGIVVIRDRASSIALRLRQRDGCGFDPKEILALQSAEIEQSKLVSKELGLPLVRVGAFDRDGFEQAIQAVVLGSV